MTERDALASGFPGVYRVAERHRGLLRPHGVQHRHDWPRLKNEGRQHGAKIMDREWIITIHQHVAAPVANADDEHLDLEILGRFPLQENLEDSLLGVLVV